nr:cak assembly factor [Hymenolepis microstoma]
MYRLIYQSNYHLETTLCSNLSCENCVEVLFARGSGLCVECKTPIRKVNFRYQLFEDPTVQKEVDIRKKVLVEKFIEQYKKDNKDIIKRNRTKLSKWAEFYESELEHERAEREARAEAKAAEDAANLHRRKRLVAAASIQGFLCGPAAVPLPETTVPAPTLERAEVTHPQPTSELPSLPQSALPIDSRYRFLPPPTSALPSARPMAPPSAIPGRWAVPTPFAPASGMSGVSPFSMPTVLPMGKSWGNTLDPLTAPKADKVVLSRSRTSKTPVTTSLTKTGQTSTQDRTLCEWLKPYKPDVVGPHPPNEEDGYRWDNLMSVYLKTVVEPLTARLDGANLKWKNCREEEDANEVPKGLSHVLPVGTTGISPSTHLYRALEESRCFLFNPQ